ncbi:phage tail tape measure protein [Rhodobacter maris]|uniref:Uncharacterized protein n=1 Tax=Rhodobacter maris TaxID=446682 RepID=A0A285TIE4_9RHOB|nr:hypothetical protein [Rhodobacter maris]SOC21995.1 hypothetical protein SAMN05877831_12612 [Rhodobacter maris]
MASSVIGALRVNLGLDAAQFSKGLKGSQGTLASFAARAGKMAGGIAASMQSAFVAMGLGAINAGAEIQRLSTLANTTPEQFQGWAAGARSVGIEEGKLSDILKDTNDRVGDFLQTGGGEMADFFEKIAPKVGVTAAQFRNLSGADALQLYVTSLETAKLSQAEMIYYMEAVADEASGLLPLLRNGGAGMAEYAAMAERVGAVMDGSTIASLKAGKGALAQMQLAWTGLQNTIGAMVVPALMAAAEAVTAVASSLRAHAETLMTMMRTLAGTAAVVATLFAGRFAIALGTTAVRAIISASAAAATYQMTLGRTTLASILAANATRALAGAFTLMGRALIATGFGALIVGAGWLVGKFMALVAAAGGFGKALSLLGAVASGVWDGIVTSAGAIPDGLAAVWERMKSAFFWALSEMASKFHDFVWELSQVEGLKSALVGVVASASALSGKLAEAGAEAGEAADKMAQSASSKVTAGFEAASAAVGRLGAAVTATNSELTTLNNGGSGGGSGGGAAGKLSDLQKVLKGLNEDLAKLKATMFATGTERTIFDKLREAGVSAASASGRQIAALVQQIDGMQALQDATDSWRQSITGAFSSFLTGASSFKEALGQIIAKLGEMMLNAAFDRLFGSTGNGFLGGILSSLGIGANANGTPNWKGGLTRINERGGEIVDLPSGTRIIPHDVSRRMMEREGGGLAMSASELTISDDGKILATVRAEMREGLARFDRALPQRVQSINANPRKR